MRHTIDLARRAEAAGYHRYWLAEHHLTPGVASSAPAVADRRSSPRPRRRSASGRGPCRRATRPRSSIVEQFGILDALHPGRIDLGLGAVRPAPRRGAAELASAADAAAPAAAARPPAVDVDGLLVPTPFSFAHLLARPGCAVRDAAAAARRAEPRLRRPGRRHPRAPRRHARVRRRHRRARRARRGRRPSRCGSSGAAAGRAPEVAGERGLPFAANYHVSPATMLDAVEGYRAAFLPSARLAEPTSPSPPTSWWPTTTRRPAELARRTACGCAASAPARARSRSRRPSEADAHEWTDDDRELVADRVDTQFVGSPATVADRLRTLRGSPAPTSSSSPRSPTTTPTAAPASTSSPAPGAPPPESPPSGDRRLRHDGTTAPPWVAPVSPGRLRDRRRRGCLRWAGAGRWRSGRAGEGSAGARVGRVASQQPPTTSAKPAIVAPVMSSSRTSAPSDDGDRGVGERDERRPVRPDLGDEREEHDERDAGADHGEPETAHSASAGGVSSGRCHQASGSVHERRRPTARRRIDAEGRHVGQAPGAMNGAVA